MSPVSTRFTVNFKTWIHRSYIALQLVEGLAYASKPMSVVELLEETPFERSYSAINKALNAFGLASLLTKTINKDGSIKTVQSIDPVIFSKITKPFSA